MKLRNKKTGEIKELPDGFFCGDNLKKICEEWEDYGEPKDIDYWYINNLGQVEFSSELLDEVNDTPNNILIHKKIGNYFESKKEAEKAVEKLKAWKRLKDAGVTFNPKVINRKWYLEPKSDPAQRTFDESQKLFKDVMSVFGGEE